MAYAKIDSDNRILEWSEEHLDGMDVEFDNGDYINQHCVNGCKDFLIENGKVIFSPTEESIEEAKRRGFDAYSSNEEVMEAVIELADNFAELKKGVDKWLNFLQLQSTTGK